MKHFSAFMRTAAAFAVLSFSGAPAVAQESADAAAAVRPTMPRLFYTNEQRRILEVVRQQFITEENLEFEEFAPLLIEQQEVLEVEEEAGRQYDLSVSAFIRNRKSGDGVLWLNNEPYPLTGGEAASFAGQRLGEISLEPDGAISGVDAANNSRFIVRVGQKLAGDGEINETYPVIVVKKQ